MLCHQKVRLGVQKVRQWNRLSCGNHAIYNIRRSDGKNVFKKIDKIIFSGRKQACYNIRRSDGNKVYRIDFLEENMQDITSEDQMLKLMFSKSHNNKFKAENMQVMNSEGHIVTRCAEIHTMPECQEENFRRSNSNKVFKSHTRSDC